MRSICFYFQIHQPFRLRTYRFFDIADKHDYFDNYNNSFIMRRIAEKSYLPMNALLLDLIKEYGAAFKVSFSISGMALNQFEAYAPRVIDSFKELAATGNVEFLAETYAHSLSSLKSKKEFGDQVKMHAEKIENLFGQKPTTFRNTELIYSDAIGAMVADMGYGIMLTEGAKHVLGWRSPNYMYTNAVNPKLKLLLKNFKLSDDIAFRFSQPDSEGHGLTTDKFVGWLNMLDKKEEVVNLFMDYETFGEHQWKETGIFEFMRALPKAIFSQTNFKFATPKELGKELQPVSPIHVPYPISWADEERDLTAWLGNDLQDEAFDKLYAMEDQVAKCENQQIKLDWLYLQTSDHFYYMCTKWFSDGDVHRYFNPYGSPYDAFINYMNVLADFSIRVGKETNPSEFSDLKDAVGDLSHKAEKFARQTTKTASEKVKQSISRTKDFHFEDIKSLSDTAIKKLIKNIPVDELTMALKDAESELKEKILPNLGKQARKQYDQLEKELSKFKKSDLKKYRTQLDNKLKELFKK